MTTAHLSEVEMQDLIKKCCVASQGKVETFFETN
jgi:hypothetical protein